jgi:hypothetical protein
MRVIGEVNGANGYSGLVAVLRSWVCQLDTSYEAIDEVAGWQGRYVSKLLAPSALKALGRTSMGAVLGALGLKLIVAVDESALAKVRHRLSQSRWPAKRRAKQRDKLMEAAAPVEQDADAQRRALMSELGRQSHAARMARTTSVVGALKRVRQTTARMRFQHVPIP